MPIAMPGSRLCGRSCLYGPDSQDASLIADVLMQVKLVSKGLQVRFDLHSTAYVAHCERSQAWMGPQTPASSPQRQERRSVLI